MRLLLDTHVPLWALLEPEKLALELRNALEDNLAPANEGFGRLSQGGVDIPPGAAEQGVHFAALSGSGNGRPGSQVCGGAAFGAAEAAAGGAAVAWLDPGAFLCAGPGCCGGRSASR
jgi:hypothetical protein